MHISTILYGYIIQAFTLPFSTHHSPSLGRTISTTMDEQQRQEYTTRGQRQQALLLWVSHPKVTNLHLLGAMAE